MAQANDVYWDITIGKNKWHHELDLGEGRAHWPGESLRTWQRPRGRESAPFRILGLEHVGAYEHPCTGCVRSER